MRWRTRGSSLPADRWRSAAPCRYRRGGHRQQRELWRRGDHCIDRRLDDLGIAHTGAGANVAAARAPVIVERNGMRYGFLQRSSVYWPTNHEAGANSTGIAVIRAHTAYQVPMHKTRPEIPPMNRPGIPPVIITWADPDYLRAFTDDIAGLRARPTSSSRLATGGCTRTCWRICARSATRRSTPAPISSSVTARTIRCRSRCIAASRSSMDWAASRSTPAMVAARTATGSA